MKKLPSVVEAYLGDLRRIRASGGATGERSGYGPLPNLHNEIGGGLKPKVFCVSELADEGAGHPDCGLYAAKQVQRGSQPKDKQLPEHGVVEVKPAEDDACLTAGQCAGETVLRLLPAGAGDVHRDFLLMGEDARGNPARQVEPRHLAKLLTSYALRHYDFGQASPLTRRSVRLTTLYS